MKRLGKAYRIYKKKIYVRVGSSVKCEVDPLLIPEVDPVASAVMESSDLGHVVKQQEDPDILHFLEGPSLTSEPPLQSRWKIFKYNKEWYFTGKMILRNKFGVLYN